LQPHIHKETGQMLHETFSQAGLVTNNHNVYSI
jgi:hypothetical protein